MQLLAPTIQSPVTALSTSVVVKGATENSKVSLLVNGNVVPTTNIWNGVDWRVTPNSPSFAPNGILTATYSLNGVTSVPSLPVTVIGAPLSLPAPRFESVLHIDIDMVRLGGLFDGSTVEVVNLDTGKIVAGPWPSTGSEVDLPIRPSSKLDRGHRLEARQSLQGAGGAMVSGPTAVSLPLEMIVKREAALGTPLLVSPLHECSVFIQYSGAVPGGELRLARTPSGAIDHYFVSAPSGSLQISPRAGQIDQFVATAVLNRSNMQSLPSSAAVVDPALPLPTPAIQVPATEVCVKSVAITVTGLTPTAWMTVELRGALTVVLGSRQVVDFVETIFLGDLASLLPAAIVVIEELCGKKIESPPVYFGNLRLPGSLGAPSISDAFECGEWIGIKDMLDGTVVDVMSDAGDWPVLASSAIVVQSRVRLVRPLRKGEKIWLKVAAGCNSVSSNPIIVQKASNPAGIAIQGPVRPGGDVAVTLKSVIFGTRLHILVNSNPRISLWAFPFPDGSLRCPLGALAENDTISVYQEGCGRFAGPSVAKVEQGRLKVQSAPASLISGEAEMILIRAFDAAVGTEVTGMVYAPSGHVGWLGNKFHFVAPAAPGPATFTVNVEGFSDGTASIPVNAPVVPPPVTSPPVPQTPTLSLQSVVGKYDYNFSVAMATGAKFQPGEAVEITSVYTTWYGQEVRTPFYTTANASGGFAMEIALLRFQQHSVFATGVSSGLRSNTFGYSG